MVYDISSKPPSTIGGSNDDTLKISTYLAADLEILSELFNDASATQLCGGWFNEIPSYRTKFLSVKMG